MSKRTAARNSRPFDQKIPYLRPSMFVKDRSEAPAEGTSPSFPEIFRSYAPYLFRALIGLGVPASDADDMCPEVMLVVHKRLPEFDGRALKSWLYGICLRVASDYRRRAVRREIPVGTYPEQLAEAADAQTTEARLLEQRLLRVLDRLDEEKRAAFVLYEIEELTIREIAESMGCHLQTAYSRLKAARTEVRSAFTEEHVE
jgi:RNA polymerase sigma-70 factor (ECF subfamily)